MYGKTKLTKRQIKEDRFTVFMLNARQQIQDYWQYLAIGAIVVVLAIVGVLYYFNSLEAKETEASQRFAQALQDYAQGNTQVAVMGLSQLLDEYGHGGIGEQATYLLGSINERMRNYPEAIRYYEMYLANYPVNKLNRAGSLGGIAACLENQAQYEQAAAKFIEAYEEYPDGPLTGDYYLGAMRNYLALGDVEQAHTYLDLIKESYEGSPLARKATRLFAEKSRSAS